MVITRKPMQALEAADLMSETVLTIPQEMSLQVAARVLSQAHISGAPVVDAKGHCVGVLSATDFMRWAEKSRGTAEQSESLLYCQPWLLPEEGHMPADAVDHFMCKDPVTVAPHVRIGELARMMLDAHIHRIIVVDAEKRPIGIITTTDLLAALAYAEAGV